MAEQDKKRAATREQVAQMQALWAKAPAHIKAMAGAYVGPLIAAISAVNEELEQLKNGNK